MIKLSICIPVYNRADLLKETLDSIIPQAIEGVEIAVCDNGSQDEIDATVQHYQSLFPRLTYFRFPENQGADRCYIQSVAIAHGEYCWLMGSDDKIEPGSVKRILEGLEQDPHLTGITVNVAHYDSSLSKRIVTMRSPPFEEDRLVEDFASFFPHLYIHTGFLSAQVVKRSLWMDVVREKPVEQFFNAYVLVYIMMHMMRQNPRWLYIHQRCVGYRSDNDSFLDKGAYRRLEIDIVGLGTILSDLFPPHHPIYRKTMRQIGKVDVFARLLRARLISVEEGFWKRAFILCSRSYSDYLFFWGQLLPVFLIPSFIWRGIRFIYRMTGKKRREKRELSCY